MSDIVWLASYPKSGNTWLRVLLENYKRDDGQLIDINAIEEGHVVSARAFFDAALGVESSDLTADELERLRPAVFRHAAEAAAETLLLKTHDAYTFTDAGEPWVPTDVTRGTIYIVRNPLDVAVSFAHHLQKPIDAAIECMAQSNAALVNKIDHLDTQVRQKLHTWSEHVMSWIEQTDVPFHLMRYEEMLAHPLEAFGAAVRFIGWEHDAARLERAVRLSSFEALQAQEREHDFKERLPGMTMFFRKGKAGSWREELDAGQVERIIRDHGTVMRRLGYLEE